MSNAGGAPLERGPALQPHRRRRALAVAVAVLAVAALFGVVVLTRDLAPAPAGPAVASTLQPGTVPPAAAAAATPTPGGATVATGVPVEVRLDAVGLDATVLPTASVGGAFDPPTLGEAYWIEAFGAPGTASDNTVYVLGHSWDDGAAVFNPLFDRSSQTSRVAPGDEVVVRTDAGEVTYEVQRTERIPKTEIAQETNEIWDVVPGRLLLITCFQNSDGGSTADNFVVFADVVA